MLNKVSRKKKSSKTPTNRKLKMRNSAFSSYDRSHSPLDQIQEHGHAQSGVDQCAQTPTANAQKLSKMQYMPRVLYEDLPSKDSMQIKNYIARRKDKPPAEAYNKILKEMYTEKLVKERKTKKPTPPQTASTPMDRQSALSMNSAKLCNEQYYQLFGVDQLLED